LLLIKFERYLASLGEKLSEDGKADADPESFSDIDDVEVPLFIHLLSTLFRLTGCSL
jgi:hypothetical protein